MAKQIHINLSDDAAKELEDLKKELGLPSIAELIRSSITVNKFLHLEREKGNDILLRNKDTKEEQKVVILQP